MYSNLYTVPFTYLYSIVWSEQYSMAFLYSRVVEVVYMTGVVFAISIFLSSDSAIPTTPHFTYCVCMYLAQEVIVTLSQSKEASVMICRLCSGGLLVKYNTKLNPIDSALLICVHIYPLPTAEFLKRYLLGLLTFIPLIQVVVPHTFFIFSHP